MNNDISDNQFSEDLDRAIGSLGSIKVPQDAVQRVAAKASSLASTGQPLAHPDGNGKSHLQRYLFPLFILVAFLTPIAIRYFGEWLSFLPGWEQPGIKGAFAGAASMILAFLVWTVGSHIVGTAPKHKRRTSPVGWVAQVAALIMVGWVLSGFLSDSGNLYAQMKETLSKVKSIQYVMTTTDTESDQLLSRMHHYAVEPNFIRVDVGNDKTQSSSMILNFELGQCLNLDHESKEAELTPLYEIGDMQQSWKTVMDSLRTIDENAKRIGESTVGGKRCEDFEIEDDVVTTVISIDKESSLPVLMKMTVKDYPNFLSVADQFVFDEDLDPKLFSLTAPADYETKVIERKASVDDSEMRLEPGVKLGTARFGMAIDKIVEAIGEPDSISEFESTILLNMVGEDDFKMHKVCNLGYASRGFQLTVDEEKGLIDIHLYGMTTGEKTFGGQVGKGIKMGDSPEAVKAILGKPLRMGSLNNGEMPSDLIYKFANGSAMRLSFENSKLVMVINRKLD